MFLGGRHLGDGLGELSNRREKGVYRNDGRKGFPRMGKIGKLP